MAHWGGYLECWKDFIGRSDHYTCTLDYFKTHEGCIKPETTKHLLSLGPGTGEIDYGLVSLLPHLTSYTAVDPDVGSLDTLKGRLEEFSAIEKHYVNDVMETYTGPPYSADIILMSHVGYYIAESFMQQIGCVLSWLNKEGGRILLVHENSINQLLASQFDVHSNTYNPISVEDVRHHLVDMGVNFIESAIDYTLDVSYPGPSYYGFVSVLLNRRATKEEVDKALTVLRQVSIPGTEKVLSAKSLFVIQNTPNMRE